MTHTYRQRRSHACGARRPRSLGVGIAFDDFGTGFASLSLLQQYPFIRLKIDRSFIARIDRKVGDAAAEGVEPAEQEAALVNLGCDEAQGYRYGRAMPACEIADTYLRGGFVHGALEPASC